MCKLLDRQVFTSLAYTLRRGIVEAYGNFGVGEDS